MQCGQATHYSLPNREQRRSHGKQPIRLRSKNETHWASEARLVIMHLPSPHTSFPTQVINRLWLHVALGADQVSLQRIRSLARCNLHLHVDAIRISSKLSQAFTLLPRKQCLTRLLASS